MNKYIGVLLGFLSVLALVPRLEAESHGYSLIIPGLFVLWAIGTLFFTVLTAKELSFPEETRATHKKKIKRT